MQTTQDDPNELDVINFVPDEVCVVVAVDSIEDGRGFYEHVRSRLNRQIVALLSSTERQGRNPRVVDPFAMDLTPTVLRERFATSRAPLQPLRRPGVSVDAPRATAQRGDRDEDAEHEDRGEDAPAHVVPWASFQHAEGRSTRHLYFKLGPDSTVVDRMDDEQRRIGVASVRELCLLLNRSVLSTTQEPFANHQWSVTAATPNWLTFAAQIACGCPGGLPVAVPPPASDAPAFRWGKALAEALEQPPVGQVIVAVLDTCPDEAMVDRAVRRYSRNTLLLSVHQTIPMNRPRLLPHAAVGQHLGRCLPRLQWDMQSGPAHDQPDRLRMADHGLFVTGIVYQLLETLSDRCRVHLIRVLDDYGIGDLFAITQVLAELPRQLLGGQVGRTGEPRLVVNLSLGIDVPIPARLLDRWFPATSRSLDTLRARLPDVCGLLELAHASLADAMAALNERGILVVAAAGNDALRRDLAPSAAPPPPRFPARYDNVLGVAATCADLTTAANYSNRGEMAAATWPGDVSTFGGKVKPSTAANAPTFTDPSDAPVGIFSSEQLPGGEDNSSGLVYWAGTSFASPIVAAAAARLWAADPTLAPSVVIERVHSLAHHLHTGADPDAPLGVPVLEIRQS